MVCRPHFLSWWACACILVFLEVAPNIALSQSQISIPTVNTQILVLDIRKVLNDSSAGQFILNLYKEEIVNLNNEFNILQTQLIAEEQELRDVRPTMEIDAFVKLAEAFDKKSTQTREEYRARKQTIDERLNQDTDRLARILSQYAGEVMEEKGASVVLMKNQVIVSSNAIDITSIVMERADQLINIEIFLKPD